jgi:hypothetical protein
MSYSIEDITKLANAMVDAEQDVKDAELRLERTKERLRKIREDTIPGVMQELGLSELRLATGEKLSIKQDVYSQLANENKGAAYNWLEENGFGGLIKVNVVVDFGKGELERAKKLQSLLAEKGLSVTIGESVHWQTMKAFLNEQIKKEADIPLDLFGATPIFVAKITKK